MRRLPKSLRPLLLFTPGLLLALASAMMSGNAASQSATPTPPAITATLTHVLTPAREVGSTDGIVLMAIVLVVVVILPILWFMSRKPWLRS